MNRKFEIVEKPNARTRITIAKNRITIKVNPALYGFVSKNEIEKRYNVPAFLLLDVEYTIRGDITWSEADEKLVVRFQLTRLDEADKIAVREAVAMVNCQ
jgi:hypothetical protein